MKFHTAYGGREGCRNHALEARWRGTYAKIIVIVNNERCEGKVDSIMMSSTQKMWLFIYARKETLCLGPMMEETLDDVGGPIMDGEVCVCVGGGGHTGTSFENY
jgi:hypothetical protein